MQLEIKAEFNGICIKKIFIRTVRDKVHVEVQELREDNSGKTGFLNVYFHIFDTYEDARMHFMGAVMCSIYENANNTQDTDRENIFQRGSLPHTPRRGGDDDS